MTELLINGEVLDYKDYAGTQDALFNKLIQFIALKGHQSRKDRVEVINACDYCGHALQKPYDSFASEVNPSDIWYISILDENEEDWLKIMGEDADFTQEQILIYRCQACGKWEICNDG
ncbi:MULTISPECIES: hypothetical protein [Bacillus cereus group]|uniref:Uncharacterized protein n=2 Tax=root TaxID=1 RepID=A0A1B1P774_9CAUD|nr:MULTISPECIES: hypothetical protein [Bacillus cereus group]YP_009830657.1 hypothetical protein HWA95_gp03 [Bacillus phage vB_BtS_BMBtp14]ANT39963.1 hypothetical protein BMBtpLA2_3 [Bacillus phage vB_BtS_BMBtp14]EEM55849.1 hypothetical protein bthur0007_63090 [Bacillus thuringiensis serovar monterrey BGSC 4AJ1]MEB9673622.1 hypothetical protein [Bacillus anthracis]OTX09791.1 hypothetical protein BK705_04200 [Bacillus thuringiensis serovar monterrey]OTX56296.1 hypothetical protein BK724_00055 